jgi:hypothetical protein
LELDMLDKRQVGPAPQPGVPGAEELGHRQGARGQPGTLKKHSAAGHADHDLSEIERGQSQAAPRTPLESP